MATQAARTLEQLRAPVLEYWRHELTYVRQFMDWGVRDFAERYVANPAAVESEA